MDEFRKGAKEWGSKARKEENPKCRAKLKRTLPELLKEARDLIEGVEIDIDSPLPPEEP